jgi:DNA helicase-2/ATP-dependent DNA helicase PcrA
VAAIFGTFHSFCVRVLRSHGQAIGLADNFVIYDERFDRSDQESHPTLNLDIKPYKLTSFKAAISSAKNELIPPLDYASFARGRFQELTAAIYREYNRLLQQFNAQDFDDLLINVVRLLKNDKAVFEHFRQQFEQVLIDEYQDTNKAQYKL